MEYELLDTGVFDDDRYFDVFVEYAKGSPEDMLIRITVCNRGPEPAELHVLPTLWFRNDWSAWIAGPAEKPTLRQIEGPAGTSAIAAMHPVLGPVLPVRRGHGAPSLYRERDEQRAALSRPTRTDSPYVKDGINNFVVHGQAGGGQSGQGRNESRQPIIGSPSAAVKEVVIRLRLTTVPSADAGGNPFGQRFDALFAGAPARGGHVLRYGDPVIPGCR